MTTATTPTTAINATPPLRPFFGQGGRRLTPLTTLTAVTTANVWRLADSRNSIQAQLLRLCSKSSP